LDDEETTVDEALAELDVPRDHLRAEAGDQQERGVAGIAEGLVLDLDTVARCTHGRHR
jgi:hypothetical protein